jgi:hypothetical protein
MQMEAAEDRSQDCRRPGCPSATLSTAYSWTPPPQTLVPGEEVVVSAAIDSCSLSAVDSSWAQGACVIVVFEDPWPIIPFTMWADEDDVDLLNVVHHEDQPDSAELTHPYEAAWQIPPCAPGDRLALRFLMSSGLSGIGCGHEAEIEYHYLCVALDPTPEPVSDENDEGPREEDGDLPSADEDDESIWSPPEEEPEDIPPETIDDIIAGLGGIGAIPGPEGLTQALAGIALPAAVLSALTALGYLAGGGYGPDPSGPAAGPPGGAAGQMTLTDTLGNQHDYEWDPNHGGYINPATGGMLDPTLWNEYNRNLAANRAFIDRERERLEKRDTDFDRRVDELDPDRRRRRREGLEQSMRDLEKRGYALGDDGARAAAHARRLAQKVRAGETISRDKAQAIERFISNREAGRTAADTGDHGQVSTWDVGYATAAGIVRNVITGRNEDGSTSWAGLGVRVAAGVATLGQSEYVFVPASATYVYHDSRARGQSRGEAVLSAAGGAVLEVAAGKALQGVAALGGRALSAAGRVVDDVAPGLSSTMRSGARGLAGEFDQVGRFLGGKPLLTTAERNAQSRIIQAIRNNADDDLRRLYQGNGRQVLGSLERKGGLTTGQAQRIRKALSTRIEAHLDDGMDEAFAQFGKETGIQPEEVLVGDSGSTARGGPFAVGKSDFDRTVVPRFSQADVQRYRAQQGLGSDEEAVEALTRRFRATYEEEVEGLLRNSDGLTGQDVSLELFDRIQTRGPGGEVYPFGYTNARQSAQGRARVYRPGRKPYSTSGDALVDQNTIEIGRAGQRVPGDPVRMNAEEFAGVVRRQVAAGSRHHDGTSLAKAVDRAREPMQRLGMPRSAMDTRVHRIARQIRSNPQQQAEILRRNGMTEEQFVERARGELGRFAALIS